MSGKYDLESRRHKYSSGNGTFRRLDQPIYDTFQLDNRGYVAYGEDANRNDATNYNERAIDVPFLVATSPTAQGVESSSPHQKVAKKKHKNAHVDRTTENASTPAREESPAKTQVTGSKTQSQVKKKSEEKKHGGFFKRLTHSWRKHDSEQHHGQKVKRKHTDDTSSSSSSSSGHGETEKTNGGEMFEIKLPHSSSKTSFDSKHSEHHEHITKMDLSEFGDVSGAAPNHQCQVTGVVLKDNFNAAPDKPSDSGIAPDGFNTSETSPDYSGNKETTHDYSNTNVTNQDYVNNFVAATNCFNGNETFPKYLSTNEKKPDYFSNDDNALDYFNMNDTFLDYFNTREPAPDYANANIADYDDVADTVQEDYETFVETNGDENFSTDLVNVVYEDVVVVTGNISQSVEENIPNDSDNAVEVIPYEDPHVTFETLNTIHDPNNVPMESRETQKEDYFIQRAPQDFQAPRWITFDNIDSEQQPEQEATSGNSSGIEMENQIQQEATIDHSSDSEQEQQAHQEATTDHSSDSEQEQQAHQVATIDHSSDSEQEHQAHQEATSGHSSDSEQEQQAHQEATLGHSSDSEQEQQAHQEATSGHSSDSSALEYAEEDTRCGSQSDNSDIVVEVMQSYDNQTISHCPSEPNVLPTEHQVLHHSEKKIFIVDNQTIHHSEKYFFIPANQSYGGEDRIYILDDISIQHTEDYFKISNCQELSRIEDHICFPDSQQDEHVSSVLSQSKLNHSSSSSSFTSSSASSSPKSPKKIPEFIELDKLPVKIGNDNIKQPEIMETEMYVVTLLGDECFVSGESAPEKSTETSSPTEHSLAPSNDSGLDDSLETLSPIKTTIDRDSQFNTNGSSPEDNSTPVQMPCAGQEDGEGLMEQLTLIMERGSSQGVGHKVTSEKPEDVVHEINCKTEPVCHVIQDKESGEVVECPSPALAHDCTASLVCESDVSTEHTGQGQAANVSLTHVHQDGDSVEIPTQGSESPYIHVKQDGKLIQLLNPRHFLSKIKKLPGKSLSGGKIRKGSRHIQKEIKLHKVLEDYITVACVSEPEPERKNIDIFTVVYQPCSAEIVYEPKFIETSDMNSELKDQSAMHPPSTGKEKIVVHPLSTETKKIVVHPVSTETEQIEMHPPSTGTEQIEVHPLSTGTEQIKVHPSSTGTEQIDVHPLSTGTEQIKVHPPSTETEQIAVHPLSTRTEQIVVHPLSTETEQIEVHPPSTGTEQIEVHPPSTGTEQIKVHPASTGTEQIEVHPPSTGTEQIEVHPPSTGTEQIEVHPPSTGTEQIEVHPPSTGTEQIEVHPPSTCENVENDIEAKVGCQSNFLENASPAIIAVTVSEDAINHPVGDSNECPSISYKLTVKEILDLDLPESSVNQHSRRGSSSSSSGELSSGAEEEPIKIDMVSSLYATHQVFDTQADDSIQLEQPLRSDFVDYENTNNLNDTSVVKVEDVSVNAGSLNTPSGSVPVVEQRDEISISEDETNKSLTILSEDSKETLTSISNILQTSGTEQDISDTQLHSTSKRSGSLSSTSSSSSEEKESDKVTKTKGAGEEEQKMSAKTHSPVAVVDQGLHIDDVNLLHHQLTEAEHQRSRTDPDQELCGGQEDQAQVPEKEKHDKKTKKIESPETDHKKKKHTFFSWPFKKKKNKSEEVKSDEASSSDDSETRTGLSVPPTQQVDNGHDILLQEEIEFKGEIPIVPKTSTPQKIKEHAEKRLGENLTDIASMTECYETFTLEKVSLSESVSSSSSEDPTATQANQSLGLTPQTQSRDCVIIEEQADGFKDSHEKEKSDKDSSESSSDSYKHETVGQTKLKTFAKQKNRHKPPKNTLELSEKASNGERLKHPKSHSDTPGRGETSSSSSETETSTHQVTPSHNSEDKHVNQLNVGQPKEIHKYETVDAQTQSEIKPVASFAITDKVDAALPKTQSEIKPVASLAITDKVDAALPKTQKGNKISKFLPMLLSPTKKEADVNFDNVEDFSQRFDGQFHREDDVTQGLADDHCKSSSVPTLSVSKTEEAPNDFHSNISEARHFVVVAIDVGTTHSGYAFSFVRDPGSVYMMRRWSGEEPGLVNQKTLTSLLLTPEGKFHSFGYNARSSYLNLVPMEAKHWMYFSTFKMELHHNTELSLDTNLVALNGAKFPAIKVFAHCLEFFKTHALQQLSDQCGTEILNEDIRWVITVPAIWKAPAKQFMRQAAYEAGLVSPNFPEQLLIALEPEAASIYCRTLRLHELVPEHPLKRQLQSPGRVNAELNHSDMAVTELTVGSRYLIVDCGGGTVDITVHELDTTGYIKELHQATGGPYGSIGVDFEFEKLLCGIFGADFIDHYKKKYPMGWVHLMTDFESRKRSTSPNKTTFLNVSPPFTFISDFKKHKTDPELAVKRYGDPEVEWSPQGMLRLSPLAMRRLFLPTLSHIKQAIGDVLNHPNARDVKYMFLVGGFSESPLLHYEMRQEFSGLMKLLIPQEVSLAILKGAVLFGLDPSIVNVRRSRLTYGVGILNKFDPSQHPKSKLIKRSGLEWCTDIYDKYVETDHPVLLGTSVVRRYAPANNGQTSIVLNIYSSQNSQVKFITDPGVTRCGTLSLTLPPLDDADNTQNPRAIETRMSFGDTEINVVATDVSSGKMVKATVDFLGT